MGDYKILSMDDHVFEPPDLWQERIDPKFRERAPRIGTADDGNDYWYCDGARICFLGGGTQAGLRFEDPKKLSFGDKYENARPGGYDPVERIKDMDMDGVDMSTMYPTCGLTLYSAPDTQLVNAMFQAYNNWLADFCSHNPKLLKGLCLINLDDIQWGIKELERCHKMGLIGACIPSYVDPSRPYQDPVYEPFWATANDLEIPLSLHVATNRAGLGDKLIDFVDNMPADTVANMDYWVRTSLAQMILGGIFEKYPKLQVGSIEHEVSWVPYFLERLDYTYTQRAQLSHWYHYKDDSLPSDFFRRNVFVGFQEDSLGIKLRHEIGLNVLQWGSDYPHQESTFPRSRQILEEILVDCTEEEKALIAGGNGARVYHLN